MFAWVLLAFGLVIAPADAADLGDSAVIMPEMTFTQEDPFAKAKAEKEAEEAEREARLAALEEAQSGIAARVVVLVAGGFHTPGICDILDENRVSYVVIAPKVTHAEVPDVYLERLLAQEIGELGEGQGPVQAAAHSHLAFSSRFALAYIGS